MKYLDYENDFKCVEVSSNTDCILGSICLIDRATTGPFQFIAEEEASFSSINLREIADKLDEMNASQ